ncbi:MAG TPA: cyclic peptide export ABC transporter, partial [Myxococcota bacterium]|nr:cyclic peptide export ABC transporter [Myxococcota bacterium]
KVRIEDGRFSSVDLSTGQRKRLAMVVALLQDRPVFVFDEWAADQDPEFRDTYYRRILPDLKRRGKTVVCVTHDDQFFHLADRRLVIDAGRVIA